VSDGIPQHLDWEGLRLIHYHGTPIGGSRDDAARFLIGRHALVSFAHQGDMAVVADACQSFILDNGAFSVPKFPCNMGDSDARGIWFRVQSGRMRCGGKPRLNEHRTVVVRKERAGHV
jgi:hypothetical protein